MNAIRVEVDEYPLRQACTHLEVSSATLRRWAKLLREKNIPELDHQPNQKIITQQSFTVYRYLKSLINRGYLVEQAIQKIRDEGIPDEQFP